MKRIFTTLSLLALLATSNFFVSCSSDDNSSKAISQDPLLGKWTAEEMDLKIEIDGVVMLDEENADITSDLELHFEFKDGNVVSLYQKQIATGEVTEGTGTYSISGSELTINVGNPQIFIYTIKDDYMSLTMEQEELYEGQLLKMNLTYHLIKN